MPLNPVIAVLTVAARRAAPIIESAVGRGLSRKATQAILKASGMSFRRQEFLDVFRYFDTGQILARQWKNLRKDFYPNPDRMRESINPLRKKYSYKVRRDILNAEEGEPTKDYITVVSDRLLTPDEAETIAEEYTEQGDRYANKEYAPPVLEDVIKAGSTGTLS